MPILCICFARTGSHCKSTSFDFTEVVHQSAFSWYELLNIEIGYFLRVIPQNQKKGVAVVLL